MMIKYYFIIILLGLFTTVLGPSSASTYLNITSHEVSPNVIGTLSSGIMPNESNVSIAIKGSGDPLPVDVVVSIDSSSSMEEEMTRVKDAAKIFVGMMNPRKDNVGLVSWNESIRISINLTNNFDNLNATIDDITSKGATEIYFGLKESIDILTNGTDNVNKYIVFLSDGTSYNKTVHDFDPHVLRAKHEGIEIWPVKYTTTNSDGDSIVGKKHTIIANFSQIADITGGQCSVADITNVTEVFQNVSKNITTLAGKNVTVKYLAPADLIYSIPHDHIEGPNKVFIWDSSDFLGDTYLDGNIHIGEEWHKKPFKVCSEKTGQFILGKSPGSVVNYTMYNGTRDEIPIEDRVLTVIDDRYRPCINITYINITYVNNTYINNTYMNFTNFSKIHSGDININGTNINFGTIYNTYGGGPPGLEGQPIQYIFNITCPCPPESFECRCGNTTNNITLVNNIFVFIPCCDDPGVSEGVINLSIQIPKEDRPIDAIFAFDVSGSMRRHYEEMDENAKETLADSNFGNVSIIGWDEDVDLIIDRPRPLRENRASVMSELDNLSRRCNEMDLTVHDIGLKGAIDVDQNYGDLFNEGRKVVLFITGPDEFRDGKDLSDYAKELKRRGYAIYTVGVDINEAESRLKVVSLNQIANLTYGKFYPIGKLDSDEVGALIQDIISETSEDVVVKDMIVKETLPPYLVVKGTVPPAESVEKTDGTTTVMWVIKDMIPGRSTNLSIHTTFKGAFPAALKNTTFKEGYVYTYSADETCKNCLEMPPELSALGEDDIFEIIAPQMLSSSDS